MLRHYFNNHQANHQLKQQTIKEKVKDSAKRCKNETEPPFTWTCCRALKAVISQILSQIYGTLFQTIQVINKVSKHCCRREPRNVGTVHNITGDPRHV